MATSPRTELIQNFSRTVAPREVREPGPRKCVVAQLTDGELLDQYIDDRDEAALATLLHRHGPMVWGVCRRVLASHQDAEDAFQVTFLVLVRRAESIVPRERVGNWLHGVAHQTALKARATVSTRKGRERQGSEMPESAAAQGVSFSNDGPKVGTAQWMAHWNEVRAVLDEEVSRLPDNYRAAVIHCDLKGETRKVAARNLGVPEGTVAGWLARARTMLAGRLAQRGITPLTAGMLVAVLSQNAATAAPAVVPTLLVSKTIQAASAFAAGQAASAGAISVPLAALTEGVMKTMMFGKIKSALSAGLYLGFLTAGAIVVACCAATAQDEKKGGTERLSPPAREGTDRLAPADEKKGGAERLTPPAREGTDRLTPSVEKKGETDRLTPPVQEGTDRLTPPAAKRHVKEKLQGIWRIASAENDGLRIGEGRHELKDDRLIVEKSTFVLSGMGRGQYTDPKPVVLTATFELDATQPTRVIVLHWKRSMTGKEEFTQKAIYELEGDTFKLCINLGTNEKEAPADFTANAGSNRLIWTFKRTKASDKKEAKSNLGERVTESGWQLGEPVTDPASKLGEPVTDPARKLGERVTDPARKLGERVTDPARKLGERVTDPARKLGEPVTDPARKLGEPVTDPARK